MFNSELFTVKNIFVIGVLSLLAVFIYNHFSKKGDA